MYIVYRHTNKNNGKVYIGMTCRTVAERWRSGYNGNPHFKRAIDKYGWDGFEHEILAENLTKEEAETLERDYIARYDATNPANGYNIELGGNSIGKHAEETKRKISESQKGREFTIEHREKIRNALKGRHVTDDERARLRAIAKGNKSTTGQHPTEETRRKMSAAHKGKCGKSVICLIDWQTFRSTSEAADFYHLTRHKVMNNCNGRTEKLYRSELRFAYL